MVMVFCSISQVLVAFMVGMTNLYRYYGYILIDDDSTVATTTSFKGYLVALICENIFIANGFTILSSLLYSETIKDR